MNFVYILIFLDTYFYGSRSLTQDLKFRPFPLNPDLGKITYRKRHIYIVNIHRLVLRSPLLRFSTLVISVIIRNIKLKSRFSWLTHKFICALILLFLLESILKPKPKFTVCSQILLENLRWLRIIVTWFSNKRFCYVKWGAYYMYVHVKRSKRCIKLDFA